MGDRLFGSLGSDIDGQNDTLRQRKNGVREKRGKDDITLPRALRVPHAVALPFASQMTGGVLNGSAALGIAVVMMTLMMAIPRGSGRKSARRGIRRLVDGHAGVMMMMENVSAAMVRRGGLWQRALATHPFSRLMTDDGSRVLGSGARGPMIAGSIATRAGGDTRLHCKRAIGATAAPGSDAVQTQAGSAMPASEPSHAAARRARGRKPGLADRHSRTPMASGGEPAAPSIELIHDTWASGASSSGDHIKNLHRGTLLIVHAGFLRRRVCATPRALFLQSPIAVLKTLWPPITRSRYRRSCIDAGPNGWYGRGCSRRYRKAGCIIISHAVFATVIVSMPIVSVGLLTQLRRCDIEARFGGSARMSASSVGHHVHGANGNTIRSRGFGKVRRGGGREPSPQSAQDVALGLRARAAGANLNELPRPPRSKRSTCSAPDHALRGVDAMSLVRRMADGASTGCCAHPSGTHHRVGDLFAGRAFEVSPFSAPHLMIFFKIIVANRSQGAPPLADLLVGRGNDVGPFVHRQTGSAGDALNDPPGQFRAGKVVIGTKVSKKSPSAE